MRVTRRKMIGTIAGGMTAAAITSMHRTAKGSSKPAIKAIAFDAFVVFDPRPVVPLAEKLFPAKGASLVNEWRVRQFEYCWLRVLSGTYADFWHVTDDALRFASKKLRVELTPASRQQLMNAHLALKAWPDVKAGLEALRTKGYRLALLSNFTLGMLEANLKSSGVSGMFEHVVSTDEGRTYKPDIKAYQLGVDRLKLKREEILFLAFAGWDADGAKAFGFPTFWVNRAGQPEEQLGNPADGSGVSMDDVRKFLE